MKSGVMAVLALAALVMSDVPLPTDGAAQRVLAAREAYATNLLRWAHADDLIVVDIENKPAIGMTSSGELATERLLEYETLMAEAGFDYIYLGPERPYREARFHVGELGQPCAYKMELVYLFAGSIAPDTGRAGEWVESRGAIYQRLNTEWLARISRCQHGPGPSPGDEWRF